MKKSQLYGKQMKLKEIDQHPVKKPDGVWLLLKIVYGMLYPKYVHDLMQ